ncbi:2OG-Fe(II) oxygenase [Pleurocapsales cyanobacterium LEGE 10410]|nr:2OG-Fe(II) oxygenase [Pleurocapsales cyanobacterium LEGE 10410]
MVTEFKSQLQPKYLEDLVNKYQQEYSQALPFPHIVIDNFLPEPILNRVLQEFPSPETIDWKTFDNSAEKKLASTSELQMGENTRLLLQQLNSSTFINFLEQLTGIEGIIPDPHYLGGGLHQIEQGGYLKIHVDFNRHKRLRLDRRLNLLIYLNKDWQEEYGGHFEMWNTDMTKCEKKILPIFNRCVIFNTTDFSFHGHPEPLNCPENRTRKSLALYYYSNGRPASEVADGHTTVFKDRPEDSIKRKAGFTSATLKTTLKKLLPPILIDIKKYLSHKS